MCIYIYIYIDIDINELRDSIILHYSFGSLSGNFADSTLPLPWGNAPSCSLGFSESFDSIQPLLQAIFAMLFFQGVRYTPHACLLLPVGASRLVLPLRESREEGGLPASSPAISDSAPSSLAEAQRQRLHQGAAQWLHRGDRQGPMQSRNFATLSPLPVWTSVSLAGLKGTSMQGFHAANNGQAAIDEQTTHTSIEIT